MNDIRVAASYSTAPLVIGARVIACVDGTDLSTRDGPSCCRRGAFQNYVCAEALEVAVLPDDIEFVDGVVLPLAMATATSCLFNEEQMGLDPPKSADAGKEGGRGGQGGKGGKGGKGVVLVWGAAASVGCCAVQMLVAAGYRVATSSSPSNFPLCNNIGAEWVFDYTSASIEDEILETLRGKDFVGIYNAVITPETINTCARIASTLGGKGGRKGKIVGTVYPPGMPLPTDLPLDVEYAFSKYLPASTSLNCFSLLISPGYASFRNLVPFTTAIWGNWVSAALASGTLKCLPEKLVIGKGLEGIQVAINRYEEGISARKVVVEIE